MYFHEVPTLDHHNHDAFIVELLAIKPYQLLLLTFLNLHCCGMSPASSWKAVLRLQPDHAEAGGFLRWWFQLFCSVPTWDANRI